MYSLETVFVRTFGYSQESDGKDRVTMSTANSIVQVAEGHVEWVIIVLAGRY